MNSNNIRTFICITFPDEVIKEVARVQEHVLKTKFTGKLTELENLHLTLKFLGEIPREKIEEVRSILEKIKFPKFQAKLLHAGTFNYKGNPKIIWIKVGGEEIFNLQKKIDESLYPLFEKEKRFMSHMTIARIKHAPSPNEIKNKIRNIGVKKIIFPVTSFKLQHSELKPLGPVYKTISEITLEN